jgi:ElaB/YqjD/DUF883 family membrane-anchored ribosome-binding protein
MSETQKQYEERMGKTIKDLRQENAELLEALEGMLDAYKQVTCERTDEDIRQAEQTIKKVRAAAKNEACTEHGQ